MNKERLKHHLNFIRMSESDKSICKCIERIFEEGVEVGFKEEKMMKKPVPIIDTSEGASCPQEIPNDQD